MKVNDEIEKEDAKPVDDGLTDLPVADEQAAETKGSAEKIVLGPPFKLTSSTNTWSSD